MIMSPNRTMYVLNIYRVLRYSSFRNKALVAFTVFVSLLNAEYAYGGRLFTLSNDAEIEEMGEIEYEQWVTWKTSKNDDSDFDQFNFKHELEFAVSERLQLELEMVWRYQDGAAVDDDEADFRAVALEGTYQIRDPDSETLGLALKTVFEIGDELLELKAKLILQKNIGPLIVVWNGNLEAEWEEDRFTKDSGKLSQSMGLNYEIADETHLGIEFLHELKYDDWSEWKDHVVYLGPSTSFEFHHVSVALTLAVQITDVDAEADFLTPSFEQRDPGERDGAAGERLLKDEFQLCERLRHR